MGGSKKQTVGYFYYKDLQGVLCHGPVDKITRIECSDREIFRGEITESGVYMVDAENIFGGRDREGGIKGNFEFQFGDDDQLPSSYLVQKLGSYVPASRGVVSVTFRDVYQGMNPYFRDYLYTVVRTTTGWYNEKSKITAKSINYQDATPLGLIIADSSCNYHTDGINIVHDELNENAVVYSGEEWITPDYARTNIDFQTKPTDEKFIFNSTLQFSDGGGSIVVVYSAIFQNVGQRPFDPAMFHANFSGLEQDVDTVDTIINSRSIDYIVKLRSRPKTLGFSLVGDLYRDSENVWFFNHRARLVGIYQEDNSIFEPSEADINPAHIVRDCLTNKNYGLGIDESNINDDSFMRCADRLFDEKLGMSIVWAQTTSIWEFIRQVCDHVQAIMPHEDVNTGKWTWALLRDDYDVNSLLHLDESNITSIKSYKRKTMSDMVNIVTVSYTDRDQGKVSSVTVDNPARVAQQGRPIETKVEYLGFSNSEVAGRIALRDLKTLSKELASVSFTALSVVKNLKVGDCFTWSWSDYGIDRAVMRVQSIKRAGILSSKYIIDAVEDSYSTPMESVIPYVPPTPSPNNEKAKPSDGLIIEAPYYEIVQQQGQSAADNELSLNNDGGFVMVGASTSQNALNATLLTSSGGNFEDVGIVDFCETAKNIDAIGKTNQFFVIDSIISTEPESYFKINDELMAVVSFDEPTRILTVKRGILDTQVADHPADSKLWFIDLNHGFDEEMYFEGQEIDAKLLTNTGMDVLSESQAPTLTVEMQARAFRPYPPQNVKINDEYFPVEIETDLIVTWSDRNRLSQTAGTFVSWFDEGLTIEPNTQTWIIVTEYDENDVELATNNANVTGATTYTKTLSTLQPDTRYMNITLKTLRDDYECLNPFSYDVALSTFFSAPFNLSVEFKND